MMYESIIKIKWLFKHFFSIRYYKYLSIWKILTFFISILQSKESFWKYGRKIDKSGKIGNIPQKQSICTFMNSKKNPTQNPLKTELWKRSAFVKTFHVSPKDVPIIYRDFQIKNAFNMESFNQGYSFVIVSYLHVAGNWCTQKRKWCFAQSFHFRSRFLVTGFIYTIFGFDSYF